MKRPGLLIVVAIWQFLIAFLLLISVAAIAVFALEDFSGPVVGAKFVWSIVILILLCLIGLSLAGGIGILQAKNWGRIIKHR